MYYKMWRSEFSTDKFSLSYDQPVEFTRCQWQKSERVIPQWIIYRSFMATYFLATLIYVGSPIETEDPSDQRKFLIFLTNWTYVLETLEFILALIIVVVRARVEVKNKEPMKKMPWYYKIYWIMYEVVLPSSVCITVIYWATIYDPEKMEITPGNLMLHIFNSLVTVMDFALVAHPIRALHFYWSVAYGLVYLVFSIIYQLSGGTGTRGMVPIYVTLDWRSPLSASLTTLSSVTFQFIMHITFALLHFLKVWIRNKMLEEKAEKSDEEEK